VSLAVGLEHACAVMSDGSVRCWGDNTFGQLGTGTREALTAPVLARLLGDARAVAVAAARTGTCALLDSGRVTCWGHVGGAASTTGPVAPAKDAGVHDVKLLVGTRERMCVISVLGQVQCWGATARGQLGAPEGQALPVEVPSVSGAAGLAMGFLHTCVARTNGHVSCWGNAVTSTGAPAEVPGLTDVVTVSAILGRSCAGASSGVVSCWNDNDHAEVAPGWVPAPVEALRGATALAGSCGRLADGSVTCVQPTTGQAFTVPIARPVRSLAADGESSRTCALTVDDEVWCWEAQTPSVAPTHVVVL
jgi:alpha-tubulin suppressor-like RCC1 family protein